MKKKQRIGLNIKYISILQIAFIICGLLVVSCTSKKENFGTQLKAGFVTPPDDAKPRVWWHWMNGNVSKEGIRADLEWMHRIGIGGFQNFDAGLNSPQVVENRLIYMTPEWKDAFSFTTQLADSLGLEMAIAGSPGWSESGGPWVKPEEAMKKYVWSEMQVEGGKPFTGKLPKPPAVAGPFQDINSQSGFMGEHQVDAPEFYSDAAVIAYRLPESDLSIHSLNPVITSSGGTFTLNELSDGNISKSKFLPAVKNGNKAWIQFKFENPVIIRALTIVGGGANNMFGPPSEIRMLEQSDDGINFKAVCDIPASSLKQQTLSIEPVEAKYFRVVWNILKQQPMPSFPGLPAMNQAPQGPAGVKVAELVLHTGRRVNRFEDKAAFTAATDLYQKFTPEINPDDAVNKENVIDLTSLMKEDGSLEWNPPAGNWMVVRLGYSLTGHKNGPASPEATGLEVDKLSAEHVKSYFTNYLDQYKEATNGLMGERGLQYIITDSWEAGTQNWTDKMIEEFQSRRGYDMRPWIPVLTGHIVESSEASDRFLWDFRKTLADLVAENHYNQLTDILAERNMGRYSESHEARRAFIGDGMEVKKTAAVPMGAGWTPGGFGGNEGDFATVYQADIRESSSVAHIYGKKYVAAESLTAMGSDWAWSPSKLKPYADYMLSCGLTRFVIHTSVHQPLLEKAPGMSLGPFGQWFTRNETWAEQAKAWTKYLSRSCYMLQQGKYVADIAYYYGEDNNITSLFSRMRGGDLPKIPEGYSYDFINADALVNTLSVKNRNYITPTDMEYKVLVLDTNSRYMTLSVLRKIEQMVDGGAVVTGTKPLMTPSLSDDPAEFDAIVKKMWPGSSGVYEVGKGKVYSGISLKSVLEQQGIVPDFTYSRSDPESKLFFVHRRIGDIDIYWVNNHTDNATELDAVFRVEGKMAEIWQPETGLITEASFNITEGSTTVPLHLEPNDAVFVVFNENTDINSMTVSEPVENRIADIEGSWTIEFQPGRGAPKNSEIDVLSMWNENSNPGIKYFSGTASYKKTIEAQESWFTENEEIWINLGEVFELAEVFVNGESMGIVWKEPYKINITDAIKRGENSLEIQVTNLWVNRLIGDTQPDVEDPVTWVSNPFYSPDSPLLPSGMLGPVTISGIQ